MVELFRRCVPLRQIADSEGGNGREDGEGCPQPFAVQTAFQHEHGASAHIAVLVFHPVFDGEQSFRITGCHSQNSRQPAPKDGAGASGCNRHAHADDIPGADVGCQGHHQGAERGDISLVRMIFHKIQFQGLKQITLRKPQDGGEVQVRAQQHDEQGPPPQEAAESGQPGCERVPGLEKGILEGVKHTGGILGKRSVVTSP